MRVERCNEFPVRNVKQHQFRCASADQGDDWEGNVRVTDERRQSLRKDALSTKSNSSPNVVDIPSKQRTVPSFGAGKSDSLIEDENSGSKVTGKSRGEIFLERALGTHDSNSTGRAQVLPEVTRNVRKERKQKREKLAVFVARRDEPCCYGCGAVLQSSAAEAPGFLPLATFEVVFSSIIVQLALVVNMLHSFEISYKCMGMHLVCCSCESA